MMLCTFVYSPVEVPVRFVHNKSPQLHDCIEFVEEEARFEYGTAVGETFQEAEAASDVIKQLNPADEIRFYEVNVTEVSETQRVIVFKQDKIAFVICITDVSTQKVIMPTN